MNKKKLKIEGLAPTNPLICDLESGVCEIPEAEDTLNSQPLKADEKPVKIIYFTDPICSSCWGIEPHLRKLKLVYGHDIEIEYHMGGLLPDWSYDSGGISGPADVAHHWDEVSLKYNMPIDGDVWLEDPLDSSYPPSVAFKAAQMQDRDKAVKFLRVLRELLFIQKKNITKWEYVEQAAKEVGLDTAQLKTDYEGKANDLFQEDLALKKELGVRGFPSIFITDGEGESEFVYGVRPYANFETGIKKIYPEITEAEYKKDWGNLFAKYPTLTLREFTELGDIDQAHAAKKLGKLEAENKLSKISCKNGDLWRLMNS